MGFAWLDRHRRRHHQCRGFAISQSIALLVWRRQQLEFKLSLLPFLKAKDHPADQCRHARNRLSIVDIQVHCKSRSIRNGTHGLQFEYGITGHVIQDQSGYSSMRKRWMSTYIPKCTEHKARSVFHPVESAIGGHGRYVTQRTFRASKWHRQSCWKDPTCKSPFQ